jgi:hypothetical protein
MVGTQKIDATSDQIEVVVQIDEFLGQQCQNFDNVASVLSATPDRIGIILGLKFSYFHGGHRLDGGRCGDDVGIGTASRYPLRSVGYVAACYLIQFITLTLWRSERYLRWSDGFASWRKLRATRAMWPT